MLIQSIKDSHHLTFDDSKHKYTLDGNGVPGVTGFIKGGYLTSPQLIGWQIGQGGSYAVKITQRLLKYKPKRVISEKLLEKIVKRSKKAYQKAANFAAGIGTIVHDYAYLIELGKNHQARQLLGMHEESNQWEQIKNAVEKFEEWKKQNKSEVIALEEIVASPTYQFGGKFDRLDNRNGRLILPDYKTSNGFYIDQFIQLAAYAIAIEEWKGLKVEGLEILRFGKEDGDFETLLIDKEPEIDYLKEQAIRCRQTFEFSKVWGKDKRFAFGGK